MVLGTIAVITIGCSPRLILMTAEAPFRLVILKQRFPVPVGKTIVRSIVKCTILTIIDSDAANGGKECRIVPLDNIGVIIESQFDNLCLLHYHEQ